MEIKKETFLLWQKRLVSNNWYRRFWVWWGIYSVLLVFAIGLYLLYAGRWRELLLTLAALFLARAVVSPAIYLFYKRERPYQALNFIPIQSRLFSIPTTRHNSFPSDHAASFASITAVLFWFFPALGLFMAVVSLINGWARVVLGYHYFLHILAGWMVGLASALVVIYFLLPLLFTQR